MKKKLIFLMLKAFNINYGMLGEELKVKTFVIKIINEQKIPEQKISEQYSNSVTKIVTLTSFNGLLSEFSSSSAKCKSPSCSIAMINKQLSSNEKKIGFFERVESAQNILKTLNIKPDVFCVVCDALFPRSCGDMEGRASNIISQFENFFYSNLRVKSGEELPPSEIIFNMKKEADFFKKEYFNFSLIMMREGSLKYQLNSCFFSDSSNQIDSILKCQLVEFLMILLRAGLTLRVSENLIKEDGGIVSSKVLSLSPYDYILGNFLWERNPNISLMEYTSVYDVEYEDFFGAENGLFFLAISSFVNNYKSTRIDNREVIEFTLDKNNFKEEKTISIDIPIKSSKND